MDGFVQNCGVSRVTAMEMPQIWFFNGYAQDCGNPFVYALELPKSCDEPVI